MYRLQVLDQKLSHKRLVQVYLSPHITSPIIILIILIKEAKCIAKCRKCGVDTPTVYFVDNLTNRIYMEFIDGITVKQFLYNNFSGAIKKEKGTYTSYLLVTSSTSPRFHLLTNYLECAEACFGLGKSIALTHDADIIHGDLTTSNFMLRSGSSHGVVCLAKASHVVPKLTGHR